MLRLSEPTDVVAGLAGLAREVTPRPLGLALPRRVVTGLLDGRYADRGWRICPRDFPTDGVVEVFDPDTGLMRRAGKRVLDWLYAYRLEWKYEPEGVTVWVSHATYDAFRRVGTEDWRAQRGPTYADVTIHGYPVRPQLGLADGEVRITTDGGRP